MESGEKSIVSLVPCRRYHRETVYRSLERLLEPWGGVRGFAGPGQKVLLKPNLLTRALPEEAVTTHPLIVRVLVEMFQAVGATVYIGDSPGSYTLEEVSGPTGIASIFQETGALPASFHRAGSSCRLSTRSNSIPLAAALEETDRVINLAKLKTHTLTGLTAAVKNCYGCVVGKAKARLHLEYPLPAAFAGLLLDIYRAVNPDLSIVDAVVAMEGPGPRNGRPRHLGLLLAGVNALAVDRVAAELLGFSVETVPTLAEARRRRLAGTDLSQVHVTGLTVEEAKIADFDRGAFSGGRAGAWLARLPLSWVRNLQQRRRPYPAVETEQCNGCRICFEHCPPQAIALSGGKAAIQRSRCIRCYCCQELCPHRAIVLLPR